MAEYDQNTGGQGKRFALVASRYNDFITMRLVAGALAALEESGVPPGHIDLFWVPGALEVPALASKLTGNGDSPLDYHGIVCIGCVIRGETDHYAHVCAEAVRGVGEVALRARAGIGNAILTVESQQQALARAASGPNNKGWEAARAALVMANHFRAIDAPRNE